MERQGNNKLKVFFISAANCIHTIRWVNSLSKYFQVHLIYCKGHGVTLNKPNSEIVLHELSCNAPFGYYLNTLELKKIYNEIKPDVVNVHYASGYATLARMAKIPIDLLSIWGSDVYDFPNESRIKKKILEKNVRYANNIASTSNIMAEELKRQVPNLDKKIYITPFGVDIEKFKKNDKLKEQNDNNIYIGNVKTLKEKYGINYGILAFKKLKENLINKGKTELSNKLKMKIYGDGEDREKLQELIYSNCLQNSVYLMGAIANDKVPKALNNLDIFCATSIFNSESFGVAVVEAMSCELPIVATDVDGFCEVMEDKVTGYIVNKGDIDDIANSLEKLVEDSNLRKMFGKNGRERVLKNYSWDDNVDYMSKIYINLYNKVGEKL